jgi:hypothetical protein
MDESSKGLVIDTRSDYRSAMRRANELRNEGRLAETDEELAEIEGAIARYVARPGRPARRKGRPGEGGSDVP